jgi:uncharacterized protein
LAKLMLRDRDSVLTKDGFIFRIFGYSHPKDAFICDAEYASSKVFQSKDPRAPRTGNNQSYFKFYDDEGYKLVAKKFPQYLITHEMLGKQIVGVNEADIVEARRPQNQLKELLKTPNKDILLNATERSLKVVVEKSGVDQSDFGVFGSMLHNFHHPKYSDIDFVIYGKPENIKVQNALQKLYSDKTSGFSNEFEVENVMDGKKWRFKNFTVDEYVWHQRRKMIYGLFDDSKFSGRVIKCEFEPVKKWDEIINEYDAKARIIQKGWVKLKAKVISDDDGPFIPSMYGIQPQEVLDGSTEALEAVRVISYMEEFRSQAKKDETVIVEGNLEKIVGPAGGFMQVTLTYCPRYYEQVLKVSR